ncbi:hypothetical protein SAM23877_4347 [Streptomyces ambofaciens ATCC 23877]|uniref:Uncharacterized protein n=1 Tax=Streptomyces ambofaciens (strain ATCC 23877 / 3486 / DSM 40053 / JCM 4204 / NBRC 12836 / NRRL B-2516) TaxID=278992 RepID=A0A0K2AX32_STRA7|nr:hypothetical protein SAM23877_4347 [Streptomyces ambofaciens ATCC 23877]
MGEPGVDYWRTPDRVLRQAPHKAPEPTSAGRCLSGLSASRPRPEIKACEVTGHARTRLEEDGEAEGARGGTRSWRCPA